MVWVWILLGIVLLIALLITVILLLPVYITLRSDASGNLMFRYKILWKTFGEHPDPNNPIVKALKKGSGFERIEKQNFEDSVKKRGFFHTVSETCVLLADLLKEVIGLLHHCTAKRFEIDVVCSAENAADAAIRYGQYCAVVFPVAGVLSANIKVPQSARRVNVHCNFLGNGTETFHYHFLLSVRVCRLLAAYLRVAFAEVKRQTEEQERSSDTAQFS